MGIENFVELYGGLECSVGSTDSMNFIEEKEKEHAKNKLYNNNNINT